MVGSLFSKIEHVGLYTTLQKDNAIDAFPRNIWKL